MRSESEVSPQIAEFITGWLKEIGIDTTQKTYDDGQLGEVIGRGDYDMFVWGWTPYVDPDTQLGYFTCDQIASDPDDPLNYYNDANFCDPEYDKLYQQQKVELDPEKRLEIVHEMLRRFYSQAVYLPLYNQPDLQAYRKDRFEGWQRQPAETGPVLFSNTSPSYATLKVPTASSSNAATGGGSGDDGGGSAGLIAGDRDRLDRRGRRRVARHAPPHRRRARVTLRIVIKQGWGRSRPWPLSSCSTSSSSGSSPTTRSGRCSAGAT